MKNDVYILARGRPTSVCYLRGAHVSGAAARAKRTRAAAGRHEGRSRPALAQPPRKLGASACASAATSATRGTQRRSRLWKVEGGRGKVEEWSLTQNGNGWDDKEEEDDCWGGDRRSSSLLLQQSYLLSSSHILLNSCDCDVRKRRSGRGVVWAHHESPHPSGGVGGRRGGGGEEWHGRPRGWYGPMP